MSSPPVKYLRYFDFTTYATNNPNQPLPGASVDVEYNRLKSTTDQTIDRLALIQRDDGGLKDGIITTASIADGSITTPKLADGAVTNPKLGANAVGSANIAPGSISNSHIGVAAVQGQNIAADSINSAKIVDGSILTQDIADGAITAAKLAPGAVLPGLLPDGSIPGAKLADGAVTTPKLADLAVTTPKIADAAVTSAKLAPSPALTGVPTAPTALTGTSTTQLATTQFVSASLASAGSITEAPNDGTLYGRQSLGWQRGVAVAGDVMTGPLVVPAVKLGGISNLFPMLKPNAAELQARLADDSGFAAVKTADHLPGTNILNSLGSAALRWLKLWAKDGDFSGDLAVAGNAAITGNLAVTGNFTGPNVPSNPNMVINGDMRIDQRNQGGNITLNLPTSNLYSVDRFQSYFRITSGAMVMTGSRQANAGGPMPYCLRYQITTGGAIPDAAADYFGISTPLEGLTFGQAMWGFASAKPITISFMAYSTVAGTFGFALRNGTGNRVYPVTYNLPANAWTQVSFTIPGDTTGGNAVWPSDNSAAARLWWDLGSGTNYRAPPNAWITASVFTCNGCTYLPATTGNIFYLSNVKCEIGSVATPFVPDEMQASLAKCQRYFQKIARGQFQYFPFTGRADTTVNVLFNHVFPVPMRSAPTLAFTQPVQATSGAVAAGVTPTGAAGFADGYIFNGAAGGATWRIGDAIGLSPNTAAGAVLNWDAEL